MKAQEAREKMQTWIDKPIENRSNIKKAIIEIHNRAMGGCAFASLDRMRKDEMIYLRSLGYKVEENRGRTTISW